MGNSELFESLMRAIEEGKGVADILKEKREEEIKEILLNGRVRVSLLLMEYSFLSYAIHKKNYQAINDILQIAQKNCILVDALAPIKIEEYTEILSVTGKDDVIRGAILDSATKKLYKIVWDGSETIINNGISGLLNENHDLASRIFKTGKFKYTFTQKEANELARKVNDGKYEEAINKIRKRQVLLFGVAGVVMTALAVGIATSAIFGGFASGLTILLPLAALSDGFIIGWNTFAFTDNVTKKHIAKSCGIAALIALQIGAIVAVAIEVGAVFPVIGMAAAGAIAFFAVLVIIEAVSWLDKIVVPNHKLGTEKQPGHNDPNGSGIPAEKGPIIEELNEQGNPDTNMDNPDPKKGTDKEKEGSVGSSAIDA